MADAGRLAVELGHQRTQRAALGDEMTVAAMRGEDVIVGTKRPRDADGRGFLADRRMKEAGDAAGREQRTHPLLEEPDAQHARVHLKERVGAAPCHHEARIIAWAIG